MAAVLQPRQWQWRKRQLKHMKHTRIVVTRYGGPDALQTLEEERPEPKHGQVRVRVLTAGVSLPDVMMREGVHPETPTLPFTLGDGVSGIEPGHVVGQLDTQLRHRLPDAASLRHGKGGVSGKIVLDVSSL